MLIAFQSIGYKVIKVAIPFPLFVNNFPNSDKYISFYKKVKDLVKSRNFIFIVEAGAAFTDTFFAEPRLVRDINNFYSSVGLDKQAYKVLKTQHLQTIIDSIAPDYLTLEIEPYTQQVNLQNRIPFHSNAYKEYLKFYGNNLVPNGITKLGAGAGTWDSLVFFSIISQDTFIDFIAPHIYPPHFNFVYNKMFQIDSMATQNNKEVVITESWCYKATFYELLSGANGLTIFGRDVFDYWITVDTMFINTIFSLAHALRISKVCFYWPYVKFGYLSWNDTIHGSQAPGQWLAEGWGKGFQQMLKQKLSVSGQHIRSKISKLNCTLYSTIPHTNIRWTIDKQGIITIYSTTTESVVITIYSISGATVLRRKLLIPSNSKRQINLSVISPGLYIVNFTMSTHSVSEKVLIPSLF